MNPVQPPPASPSPKTSALAVCSLVLGLLGILLCFIGPVFSIPAIICGHLGSSRINRSSGMLRGKGVAIAGFIVGYVGLAMMIVLLPIAIPNFIRARDVAMQNACINNLRLIDAAKQQWALENEKQSNAIPTQAELLPYLGRGTSAQTPTCPKGGAYEIRSVGETPACSEPGHELAL